MVSPVSTVAHIEDISLNGLRLRFSDRPPTEGVELDLRIQLVEGTTSVAMRAEVRRVEGAAVGVEFTWMNRTARTTLERYCQGRAAA